MKGDNKGSNNMTCYHGVCGKCHGVKVLVIGVLVLANALWPFAGWAVFVGALLTLGGVLKLVKPTCGHCS